VGVFDDKKFEELDWISQATEPIDSKLNEVLSTLPDELIIDYNTYFDIVKDEYNIDLSIDKCISYLIRKHTNHSLSLSYLDKNALKPLFKFEITGNIMIDYDMKLIHGGEIKFIKLSSTMDEKVLEGMLGREGIDSLTSMFYIRDTSSCLSRANEVMDILGGCDLGLRTRSGRKKKSIIRDRLVKLFKKNEWKIKDTELANKVGFWIKDYISEGNLAAFSNFCRLKVMTHKDQPIYSMEEIV
jgi:hypothetical protein